MFNVAIHVAKFREKHPKMLATSAIIVHAHSSKFMIPHVIMCTVHVCMYEVRVHIHTFSVISVSWCTWRVPVFIVICFMCLLSGYKPWVYYLQTDFMVFLCLGTSPCCMGSTEVFTLNTECVMLVSRCFILTLIFQHMLSLHAWNKKLVMFCGLRKMWNLPY